MTPYDAPPRAPVELMSDDALLAAVAARGENSGQSASSGVWFAMAVLFLALGGLRWGWQTVVFLALAITLHEIGHVIAMRLFGYKNVRMLSRESPGRSWIKRCPNTCTDCGWRCTNASRDRGERLRFSAGMHFCAY